MRKILLLLACFVWAVPASAQTYPTCPTSTGPLVGQSVNCTIPILVTTASTPLFAPLASRQYLFVENQGYANDSLVNYPICCAAGSTNAATWSASVPCNGVVIQPGGVWEPPQLVAPQTNFRVPPSDIACISPLGNVEATGLQE